MYSCLAVRKVAKRVYRLRHAIRPSVCLSVRILSGAALTDRMSIKFDIGYRNTHFTCRSKLN
jgi:hypothetical protein